VRDEVRLIGLGMAPASLGSILKEIKARNIPEEVKCGFLISKDSFDRPGYYCRGIET